MALLHMLCAIREEMSLRIVALTVDHQLRGVASKEDADYVENTSRAWGIECVRCEVDVTGLKKKQQIGTQLAARELRYRFFHEQMEAYQADFLALGHHGDDQIETMLMRFVRSADPGAVQGIPVRRPFAGGELIRPLLGTAREEIEAYCREYGIKARLDASNEETAYTRNYFRKTIIPLLKEKNPSLHDTMEHLSEAMREDEIFLKKEAEKAAAQVVNFDKNGESARFEIAAFKSFPIALQRRVYHLILNYLYNPLPDQLTYVHEAQFFALLDSGKSNISFDFPHGLKLIKSYNKASFVFWNASQEQSYELELNIPGELKLPGGDLLKATFAEARKEETTYTFFVPLESVELPLYVRTRRNGDRMSWKGLSGSKKLKDVFIDAKIPQRERDGWPMVADAAGKIIWLIGLKKAAQEIEKGRNLYICLEYVKHYASDQG